MRSLQHFIAPSIVQYRLHMQRTALRSALHYASQRFRRPLQVRYGHQDSPNPPQKKNVQSSAAMRHNFSQSAPINTNHFRALIEPPSPAARKKYRLRWDWHLRNFLIALLPPTALWICVQFIKRQFAEEMTEYEDLFPTTTPMNQSRSKEATQKSKNGVDNEPEVSLKAKLEERLERLEKELAQLRSRRSVPTNESLEHGLLVEGGNRHALERARSISKTMVRHTRDIG